MTQAIREDLREQIEQQRRWEGMSPAQKRQQLFLKQKDVLDKFLERNAISRAQYDQGLGHMRQMGFL